MRVGISLKKSTATRQMKEISLNENITELHLSLVFSDAESASAEFAKAADALIERGAKPVSLEVFAADWSDVAVESFCMRLGGKFPVNVIRPLDKNAKPVLASAHIIAVTGAEVELKKTENGSIAVKYSDGFVAYVRAFGVLVGTPEDDAYEHTLANLAELEKAVALFGCKYTDIARTWFYNDDILAWYPPFNKARTEFYSARGVFDSLLPASTGIGAPNPRGVKITSGAIALLPLSSDKKFEAFEIESPLQCGAPQYGSSFSRAVEISTPRSRRIMISGTASIEPEGATAFLDDIEKQVNLTMRVIDAILKSRQMSFADTANAVVYCLRPEYYAVFQKWAETNAVSFPHCPSYSIVCRDDLLFEVELEALCEK